MIHISFISKWFNWLTSHLFYGSCFKGLCEDVDSKSPSKESNIDAQKKLFHSKNTIVMLTFGLVHLFNSL